MDEWYTGMDSEFARRLRQMITDSGGRISVNSGYRSVEEQQILWDNSDKSGTWVAAPGSSNHNWGVAADLGFSADGEEWAHANAARYGLSFPMSYEPWHIEPTGVRDGTFVSELKGGEHPLMQEAGGPGTYGSYTTPDPGHTHPHDAVNRFDLGYQLESLNNLIMSPDASILSNPNANVEIAAEPTTGGI